ncbi:MAG: OmpA family protein, partial [Burkholderiales bacterium]
MNEQPTGTANVISEGGISAKHPLDQEQTALVGPATGNEFNTFKARIIPVACWRVEDFRFAFDSSVVKPEIKAELKHLAQLLEQHPPPSKIQPLPGFPLSIFGHADPTGNDDYNKMLSGRRATAMYALLTRRAELWEQLFSQPFGNDKWGRATLQMMLDEVSPPASEQLVAQHERDAGKRKQLFLAYMEKLCGPELKVEKTDFLGHGDDAGGKGDFQGCSEFNPVLIVSKEDQKKFDQPKNKAARDSANAPNRRVMVLIFRKGSRVDPSRWPCPRVTEGVAGCRKRFWSDGEKRRTDRLPDQPREFEKAKDTFACRFYNRLVDKSPCEVSVKTFDVRLYTPIGRAIPRAPCEITIGKRKPITERADARGIITLRDVEVPATCKIRWGFPPDKGEEPELIFNLDLFLRADQPLESDRAEESKRKLNNLGYTRADPVENV